MDKPRTGGPGPFPVHLLPPSILEMVQGVAASAGCGLEIPAVTALGVVGCSIGPGILVCNYMKQDPKTPPNVYVIVVGISGGGKSRNGGPLFQPLYDFQDQVRESYMKDKLPVLKAERMIVEKRIKFLEKQAEKASKPEVQKAVDGGEEAVAVLGIDFSEAAKPSLAKQLSELYAKEAELKELMKMPQVVMEDFTVQVLIRSMSNNQGKMLVISSDARETVNNLMGRYNRGKTDDSVLIKAWGGERYNYDRKGDDGEMVSESIPRSLVGLVIMIQPDKADELVQCASLATGGFMPRVQLLFANIDPALPSSLRALPQETSLAWSAFISGLLNRYYKAGSPYMIELSEEAQATWNAYADSKVQARNDGEKEAYSFRSRDAETARRYAGIFHACKYSDSAHDYRIDDKTMRDAIQVTEWFDWHRQKVVGFHEGVREDKQIQKIKELMSKHPRGFKLREVYKKRVAGTDDRDENLALMMRLAQKGIVEPFAGADGDTWYRLI